MAAKYGCKAYYDFDTMLADPEIDLVHVCVPSGMHAALGVRAAAAGKNVLVEKPIDVTLEAAQRLIDACHKAGVLLSCISQHRFDPDFVKAKKAIEAGEFGKPVFGGSYTKWYRSQEYYDSGDWRGTWKLDGGGALMNQSVHYVDMMQYLVGEVDEVTAYTGCLAHERIEVEDIATAIVKFKNGALGTLEGHTVAIPGFHTRLDLYGTEGSFIIENDKIREWRPKSTISSGGFYGEVRDAQKVTEGDTGAGSAAIMASSHQRQIQNVAQAILNGNEPAITGEDAAKPLAIILAVYKSAREGHPVKL
jgi:predicted dehydrogenase